MKTIGLIKLAVTILVILAVSSDRPPQCPCRPGCYTARVKRWVDGDTVVVDVDLGFDVRLVDQRMRLLGVDTPERGEPGHLEAAEFSASLCPMDMNILIRPRGKGKYGRWLVDLECNSINLNEQLKAKGW